MFAIIETLGRQYKVSVGDRIKVDRISKDKTAATEGTQLTFDRVLLVAKTGELQLGNPVVSGASVSGKIVEQGKEKKVYSFKKKRRKGYKRLVGFRRPYSVVEIESIKAA